MPWILCQDCGGTRKIQVDEAGSDETEIECFTCEGSSNPGHIYVEAM